MVRWTAAPGSDLARLRIAAHRLLDSHWKEFGMSRNEAYKRLANAMSLPLARCHIGMFDEAQCRDAIRICEKSLSELAARNAPDFVAF